MSRIISDGIFYTDADGEQKWLNGTQLLSHIAGRVDRNAKKQQKSLEALAGATARMIGEERAKHRAELEALRAELNELRSAMPLRAVKAA